MTHLWKPEEYYIHCILCERMKSLIFIDVFILDVCNKQEKYMFSTITRFYDNIFSRICLVSNMNWIASLNRSNTDNMFPAFDQIYM